MVQKNTGIKGNSTIQSKDNISIKKVKLVVILNIIENGWTVWRVRFGTNPISIRKYGY